MAYGSAEGSTQDYERALGDGPVRAVKRVAASTLRGEPGLFYAAFVDQPAVVTGLLPDDPALRGLTMQRLGEWMAGGVVEGFSRATGVRESMPAETFFESYRAGRASHNVVDHRLHTGPLFDRVRPPGYFTSNWISDRADLGVYALTLIVSPAPNFTNVHIDTYGSQGWMLLLRGEKRWTFVAPRDAFKRMDPTTAEVAGRAPDAWSGLTRYETTARAGDMILIPPGWAHQVLTLEESIGIGGSLINEYQIEASMASWLAERSLGCSAELDLAGLCADRLATLRDPALRANVERALEMHATWLRSREHAH